MKHIFFVSSNLTFAMANAIIKKENLDLSNCCLFLVRDFDIPTKYRDIFPNRIHTSYNVDPKTGRVFAGANIFKTRQNIKLFDQLIADAIGQNDFIWYTSVCSNDICSLMVSKPNCKGYYIIEDGLASYRDYNPQTFTGWRYYIYKFILLPLYPRIFCVKNHFITTEHPKFRGCIATRQDCFPIHQQYLKVIGNPFEHTISDNLPDAVISIDPWYNKLTYAQAEEVFSRLSQFIQKQSHKHLACKLHPRFEAPQNKEYKQQYLEILNTYFHGIELLAPSVVLEEILYKPTQSFYCGYSSVALYASGEGVRCYTFMPLVKGTAAYEQTPQIFEKTTIPIN